jgi:SAM-dependent methyltransferase
MLANEWDEAKLQEWGVIKCEFGVKSEGKSWDIKNDNTDGDGVLDQYGYMGSSLWYQMPHEIEVSDRLVLLPESGRGTIVKYSRTTPEEIRRVIFTYMNHGDYFLENCCGWSTFGGIAKYYGYSGIGVDIWDIALEYSRKQIDNIKNDAKVEILEMDGTNLTFNDESFDFVYCNPPFMSAEKYSGKDNDIATNNKNEFEKKFKKLLSENLRVLRKDKLCVITISDLRDKGYLVPLGAQVIRWGIDVGFRLWDFVVAECLGMGLINRKKQLNINRTAKCHEYVIVFKK